MSINTTVSLGNFYLFNETHSYASNSHYISSETIKSLGSFLIGVNRLYQYKTSNLWILKGVLKDNILILDNSFDDPDFLDEQLTILEFVGTPAKVQYECLWTYFNLPSVEEINKLSLQVTQRKVDEFTNPEKVHYYKCIDREIFNGTYDEWIVEMDMLFEKWKDCERIRLTERGHTTSQIEYHIDDKNINTFKRQYANDQISFYVSQKTSEQTNLSKHDYSFSVEEMGLSTGLNEQYLLTNISLPLSEYVDLMLRMTHTRLNDVGVIHHATVIHNHHHSVVQTTQDQYEDSLLILVEATNMDVSTILPEDSEELSTYIASINRLLEDHDDINYDDVARHATVVYNYHRSIAVNSAPEPVYPF